MSNVTSFISFLSCLGSHPLSCVEHLFLCSVTTYPPPLQHTPRTAKRMFSWKKQNPPSKQRQQQAQGGGDYSDLIAQGMRLANEDIDESGADTGDYMGDEGDDLGDMDLDDPELLVTTRGLLFLCSTLAKGNKNVQDNPRERERERVSNLCACRTYENVGRVARPDRGCT